MWLNFLLIIVGIGLVSYGARFMVNGASALAKRFKVSDLVIGLTVVSFGTSAPELTVSVVAALNGTSDLAIGNVIGSNTLNICLILGVAALITPLGVHRNTVLKEIPLSLLGIGVAFAMAFDYLIDGVSESVVSRSEGWVLLAFFVIYLYYMFDLARAHPDDMVDTPDTKGYPLWLMIGLIVAGLIGLTFGGQMIVNSATVIARAFGVSEAVIGITLVSIGTSIPELATSVVAAIQGKTDIAVGNVVGSNIFNTFLILGTTAAVRPLPLGGITLMDIGVCIAATILLQVFALWNSPKVIYRKEGGLFIGLYVIYMVYLVLNQ